jgi:hypothetical protein
MTFRSIGVWSSTFVIGLGFAGACSNDDDGDGGNPPPTESPEQTGKPCETVADCFPEVDHTLLAGEVQCLDRVRDGYCTHLCETDEDCCAVEGECDTDLRQVCSPFESTGLKMCFLSCEGGDLGAAADAGETPDEQEFCQQEASSEFICRSSGGGSENRKVCVPGDCGPGASCANDADCSGDLTCNRDFSGGYCGAVECAADADCPGDSVCVEGPGGALVCLRTCSSEFDCSFCRADGRGVCTSDVTLVESTGVSVCSPFDL